MMFPGLVAIPAEDDRDDAPRTHHVTKRDIKSLVIFLIVFAVLTLPVYNFYKRRADTHLCASNLNSVYQACSLYATANDERFPPLVEQDGSGSPGSPRVVNGKVISWVSSVFQYDPRPSIYQCPSALADEATPTEGAIPPKNGVGHSTHITIQSSYGMYAPYSAAMISLIDRTSQVVFITETSNFGSQTSYDPYPFLSASGNKIPYDGFSVGYDNSNIEPGPTSRRLTRLAFRDTQNGPGPKSVARHDAGNHVITVDGNLLFLHPGDMQLQMRGGFPTGEWQAPAIIAH